jgi:hypothetical protein
MADASSLCSPGGFAVCDVRRCSRSRGSGGRRTFYATRFKRASTVRWPAFVAALGGLSLAWALEIQASVPSPRVAPPPGAGRTAVFGIIAPDSAGKPVFVRTDSVPNVEGQAYGWFLGVGESRAPVQWTEILTLPAPAASWSREGTSPPPNVSISPDGRNAVVRGEAVPEYGVIYDFWVVAPGDPAGRYTIVVKTRDGREERFRFTLRPPDSKEGRTPDPPGGSPQSGNPASPGPRGALPRYCGPGCTL